MTAQPATPAVGLAALAEKWRVEADRLDKSFGPGDMVIALATAGVSRIVVCDDDRVERTNLHRQILFSEADVGEPKLDALAERAAALAAPGVVIETRSTRFLPTTALDLLDGVSVVLDACDND